MLTVTSDGGRVCYAFLDRLPSVNAKVATKVKMVAVNEKRAEADKILDAMGKERAEAEAQQAIADVEAKKANEATEIAAKIESEAQAGAPLV